MTFANAGALGLHKLRGHGIRSVRSRDRERKPTGRKPRRPAKPKPPVGADTPTKPPTKPPAAPKRKSGGDLLTQAIALAGMGLARVDAPVGMLVGFEAPIAGPELDRAIAGTIVDRLVIQPAVEAESRFEAVAPLIAAPLLVAAWERAPQLRGQVEPLIRMCIAPMLPAMVRELRRQRAEQAKTAAVAAELVELDPAFAEIFGAGGDPIDAFMTLLLANADGGPPGEHPAE
jgi:hypothetical protein